MKKSLILLLLLVSSLSVSAQKKEPKRGYRGFFDVEASFSSWKIADDYHITEDGGQIFDNVHRASFLDVVLSTSHGYQFNKHFYLGAGLKFGFAGFYDEWLLGLFLHIRTDQTFGKYTPFAELRTGISTETDGYLYFSPTLGYRFNFGHHTNLNVGIGMTLRPFDSGSEDVTFYYDLAGELERIAVGKLPAVKPYFTFRVGIDF